MNPIADLARLNHLRETVQKGPLRHLRTIKFTLAAATLLMTFTAWHYQMDNRLNCGDAATSEFCARSDALFLFRETMYTKPLRPGVGPVRGRVDEYDIIKVKLIYMYPFAYFFACAAFFIPLLYHLFMETEVGEITALSKLANPQDIVHKLAKAIVERKHGISRAHMGCILVHALSSLIVPISFYIIFPLNTAYYPFEQMYHTFIDSNIQVHQVGVSGNNPYEIPPSQIYFTPEFNCINNFSGPSGTTQTRSPMCQYLAQDFHKMGIFLIWTFYFIDLALLVFTIISHFMAHMFPSCRRHYLEEMLKGTSLKDKSLAKRFSLAFPYSKVLLLSACTGFLDLTEIRKVMSMALKESGKKGKGRNVFQV